jgi:hypothetical protein
MTKILEGGRTLVKMIVKDERKIPMNSVILRILSSINN